MFVHFGTVLLRLERYLHYVHFFSVRNFDRLIFTNFARKVVAVMIFFLSGFFGAEKSPRNLSSLLVSLVTHMYGDVINSQEGQDNAKEMQNFDIDFRLMLMISVYCNKTNHTWRAEGDRVDMLFSNNISTKTKLTA